MSCYQQQNAAIVLLLLSFQLFTRTYYIFNNTYKNHEHLTCQRCNISTCLKLKLRNNSIHTKSTDSDDNKFEKKKRNTLETWLSDVSRSKKLYNDFIISFSEVTRVDIQHGSGMFRNIIGHQLRRNHACFKWSSHHAESKNSFLLVNWSRFWSYLFVFETMCSKPTSLCMRFLNCHFICVVILHSARGCYRWRIVIWGLWMSLSLH